MKTILQVMPFSNEGVLKISYLNFSEPTGGGCRVENDSSELLQQVERVSGDHLRANVGPQGHAGTTGIN